MNQYNPDYMSPPGETIQELLFEKAFDEMCGVLLVNKTIMRRLIGGKEQIDQKMAQALEAYFAVPADFWLARERQYRINLQTKHDPDWFKDGV